MHHLTIDRLRTMGMQDDDGLTFIEEREKRVEFRRTKVLPTYVCRQLNAIGLQHVERIFCFINGFRDIG